ncbi:MAG TPA: hypothetical protein VEY68_15570 [Anoxybacillus sp.]|nr:hypothetical protein [Anoxybacillus sp.]
MKKIYKQGIRAGQEMFETTVVSFEKGGRMKLLKTKKVFAA